MLEPPSPRLQRLLFELRLCTARDLWRCRGRVRRLASDLPAFDSVWIDALVQLGKLTPFQAQILESEHPERIQVGPCVLVELLSSGVQGDCYLARAIRSPELRSLKLIRQVPLDQSQEISQRFLRLLSQSKGWGHPHVVVPQAFEFREKDLICVSRHVPGRTLQEFLVRRGRYPAGVVLEIGRQLLEGLSALHQRGLIHGDVRLGQVRLTSVGVAVLTEAGIQPALEPQLTPHSQLNPECYDGIAPELINTGQHLSVQGDLYALGCLLWQLLAGRPPFPGGDPLAKLVAHRGKRIRDVRDFAPDTPEFLAELILRLTAPDPRFRPATAAEVLRICKPSGTRGRNRVSRFVHSFGAPVHVRRHWMESPVVWVTAWLFALSGLGTYLSDQGARTKLVNITRQAWGPASRTFAAWTSSANETPPVEVTALRTTEGLEIPSPNTEGVIELPGAGPYLARTINHIGRLIIRGTGAQPAQIVVDQAPLEVGAMDLVLENIALKTTSDHPDQLPALLLARVQNLTLRRCRVETHFHSNPHDPPSWPVGIAWRIPDLSDRGAGKGEVRDCVFQGSGTALDLRSSPKHLTFENVLRLGSGVLVNLAPPADQPLQARCVLRHVTCRQAGSLLRWDLRQQTDGPGNQKLTIQAQNCVIDLSPGTAAVLEYASAESIDPWVAMTQFEGDTCLLSPQTQIVAHSNPVTGEVFPASDENLEIEGVTNSPISYVGEMGAGVTASRLDSRYEGPRRADAWPGIDPSKL